MYYETTQIQRLNNYGTPYGISVLIVRTSQEVCDEWDELVSLSWWNGFVYGVMPVSVLILTTLLMVGFTIILSEGLSTFWQSMIIAEIGGWAVAEVCARWKSTIDRNLDRYEERHKNILASLEISSTPEWVATDKVVRAERGRRFQYLLRPYEV